MSNFSHPFSLNGPTVVAYMADYLAAYSALPPSSAGKVVVVVYATIAASRVLGVADQHRVDTQGLYRHTAACLGLSAIGAMAVGAWPGGHGGMVMMMMMMRRRRRRRRRRMMMMMMMMMMTTMTMMTMLMLMMERMCGGVESLTLAWRCWYGCRLTLKVVFLLPCGRLAVGLVGGADRVLGIYRADRRLRARSVA
jgi:hypothetical protein